MATVHSPATSSVVYVTPPGWLLLLTQEETTVAVLVAVAGDTVVYPDSLRGLRLPNTRFPLRTLTGS